MFKIEKKDSGWKVTTDDKTYYIGEFMGNGVIYRDIEAFENGEGVCYINEYGFENEDQNASELFEFSAKEAITECIENNPYISDTGYIREDFERICEENGYSKEYAYDLFDFCTWQCPETAMNDWLDDDFEKE